MPKSVQSKRVIRSTLHEVMRGRKASVHVPKDQKRARQKVQAQIQEQLREGRTEREGW